MKTTPEQNESQPKLPNYRIYDRTGGGVRHDIYAESLDDAIEQGREWIEDGDWGKEADEYLFVAPRPELSGDEASRVHDLLQLDCAPESIRDVSYDDMDREQLDALADYLCASDDSVSAEDQEFDITIGRKILSSLDEKDVESDKENPDFRLLKLDCCVREIVRVPDLRSITSLPAVIDAHVMPGDGPIRIRVERGPETKLEMLPGGVVDGSTSDEDGYYDVVLADVSVPTMIDVETTDHGQSWDCSGEFRQALSEPND